jgi:outer membrane protein
VATSLDLSDADQRKFAAQSSAAQARTAVEIRKAEIAAAEGRLYQLTSR